VVLQHLLNQKVDLAALLAALTTFVVMVEHFTSKSALRRGKLNRPQEVRGFLEVGSYGVDLVNNILDAFKLAAKAGLDNGIGADGKSLSRHFAEAALVYEILDRLKAWISISNKGLNESQHLGGGCVNSNKNTIVKLTQSEQLEDLLHFRRNANNTTDTDHKHQFLFWGYENLVIGLGITAVVNSGFLQRVIFSFVLLSLGEYALFQLGVVLSAGLGFSLFCLLIILFSICQSQS